MKKTLSLTLTLAMLLCLLAGCGGSGTASGDNAGTADTAQDAATDAAGETGDAATSTNLGDTSGYLLIAEQENPDIVDPQVTTDYYTVGMNIFDRLFEVQANSDGTSHIVNSLAKDYSISEDGLTYTFELEQGVKYSNGADLTASDVLYTIKRMLTYEKARNGDIYDMIAGAQALADGETDELSGFELIDDYNFSITLDTPYAAFLACLTTPGASIFDEETTEAAGDQFGLDPAVTIGTGPFVFTSWTVNSDIVLSANPDCWSGAPNCDGLIIKFVPDESTQRMMFESGELDLLDLDNAPSQMEYFLGSGEYSDQIVSGLRVGIYYICLNESFEPLDNVLVRQALQRSIDRGSIIDALYAGQGQIENGIFPHGLIGYNPDLPEIPYDPDAARDLLAEAGYADGFDMELCHSSDAGQTTKNLLEIVAAQWGEIGVNVTVREIDDGSFLDMRAAGEIEAYQQSWSADFNDPDNFIYTFWGTEDNSVRRGFNYANTDAINRVAAARAIVDEDERVAEYQALEKLIVQDEAAWVPLFSKEHLYVVNPRVSGFTVSWNGWSNNYYHNVSVN